MPSLVSFLLHLLFLQPGILLLPLLSTPNSSQTLWYFMFQKNVIQGKRTVTSGQEDEDFMLMLYFLHSHVLIHFLYLSSKISKHSGFPTFLASTSVYFAGFLLLEHRIQVQGHKHIIPQMPPLGVYLLGPLLKPILGNLGPIRRY